MLQAMRGFSHFERLFVNAKERGLWCCLRSIDPVVAGLLHEQMVVNGSIVEHLQKQEEEEEEVRASLHWSPAQYSIRFPVSLTCLWLLE